MRRRKLQMKIGLERTSVLQNKEPPPIVDNQYVLMELFQNKAELLKVGIFFHTQFPSLGNFINKKVGNRKN